MATPKQPLPTPEEIVAAQKLLTNKLLAKILEEQELSLYKDWKRASTPEKREQLFNLVSAIDEVRNHVRKQCERIIKPRE